MKKKKNELNILYIFLIIFLFSYSLRVIFLNGSLFHFDAVSDALAIEKTMNKGKLYHDHAYSYVNVLINAGFGFLYRLFGITDIEFIVKMNNVLFNAFACAFLFLVIFNFYKKIPFAIFSAVLLSISPIFLSLGTYYFNHSLAILLLMLSFLFLSFFYNNSKRLPLILSIFFFLNTLLIRFEYILFGILTLFIFLVKFKKAKFSMKLHIVYSAIIFLVCIILLIILRILLQKDYIFSLYMYTPFSLYLSDFSIFITNLWIFIDYSIKSLTLIGLITTGIVLIVLLAKKRYFEFSMFFISISIPLIYFSNMLGTQPRYFLPAFLPMIVVMAYGADMLYRKLPVLGISVVIILSIIMFSSIYPIINFRHQYSTAREFASFINITTEPDSVLILYGDDRPMMEFYTKRAYIDYPNTWYYDDIYDLFSRMNSTLESGKKVYLSETVFILDDGRRAREIYNLMNYEFNLIPIGILLWENPHISEVISQKYNVTLFRVEKKAV